MNTARNKNTDFEVNLLPVISVLAVCICFLLLTAVWVHLGTLDTAQAIGAESASGAENPPSIVAQLDPDNSIEFELKDVKQAKQRQYRVGAAGKEPNWEKVDKLLAAIREHYPELKTSIVLTRPRVTFGQTMKLVDALKKVEITDVGISPI